MKTNLCATTIVVGCSLVISACSSSPTAGSGGSTPVGTAGASAAGAPAGASGAAATGGSNSGGGVGGASGGTSGASAGGASIGGAGAGGTNTGGASAGGTSAGGGSIGGAAGAPAGIVVALGSKEQVIEGFGINDVFQPTFTTEFLDTLFTQTTATTIGGIGLSIMRVGMSPTGDLYNGADDIKAASTRGVTKFIASAWTAPANCKTGQVLDTANSDANGLHGGGHMANDGCYTSWANTIAAFPAKVKAAAGVDLYAMSPANEPDFASCGFTNPCNGDYDTMLYTGDEATKLVKLVGPLLHALTPPIKLISPEPSEWNHLWTNMSPAGSTDPLKGVGYDYGHAFFKDTTAWGVIDFVGTHQYDSQVATPWPSDVTSRKPIFETEMSGVAYWPEQGPSSDINNGVVVAGWIHDALVNGPASAWVWWWPKPLTAQSGAKNVTNDNEGLWLQNGTKTKRLYTLGNFSNFIRPGYTRVDVTGNTSSDVLLSAYTGTDGTVVIVAINKGAATANLSITISGGTAPATLTPWVTSSTYDMAAQTAVAVAGGMFSATLASKTVTTFVGK